MLRYDTLEKTSVAQNHTYKKATKVRIGLYHGYELTEETGQST